MDIFKAKINEKIEFLIAVVLSVFMIVNFANLLVSLNPTIKVIGILTFGMFFILYVYGFLRDKFSIRKISFYAILYLSIANIFILVVYYITKFIVLTDTYGLQTILSYYDEKAKFIYFAICFLQPIILPLPEPITIMAGSTAFGPMLGAAIGFTGTILGIITMFLVGRFASQKFISRIISEENLEKFNKYREKNETLVLLGLFILPILPDEIICIGGGIAQINPYKFIIIAVISKLITSISLSYSLSFFDISLTQVLIIAFIVVVIFVAIRALYNNIKKK